MVLWLSNNSFSGQLPAVWGDRSAGWGVSLQRLFLDGNQLTGTLPELWSSSDSLSNLGKVDVSNNQLSGSVPWSTANMPLLFNFIVLPGMLASSLGLYVKQVLSYERLLCVPKKKLYMRFTAEGVTLEAQRRH